VVARLFLARNSCPLRFDPQDAVHPIEQLAAGTLKELELAAWFRQRMLKK
jgi:prophage maintenance system killer protein